MTKFKYKAYCEKEQKIIDGEVDAKNSREAREKIRELGYLPTKVYSDKDYTSTQKAPNLSRDKVINRLSIEEKILLTSELEVLLSSQIPIIEALTILSDNSPNYKIKRITEKLCDAIKHGSTLKEAFGKYVHVFDEVYVGLIAAGESSGDISKTFERLLRILNKQKFLKDKMISASIYPAILIALIIGVLAIFGALVLPRFAAFYTGMGVDLPLMAQMLFGFTQFMSSYWWLSIIGISGIGYGLFKLTKLSPVEKFIDKFNLSIPYLCDFTNIINLANYTAVLSVAYDSGMPITQATEMATSTIKNHILKNKAEMTSKYLAKGHTLYDSLNMAHILSPTYMNMILTGEKTGELGKMLGQITDIFDKKTEQVVEAISKAFEPALIIVMGIVVGFLLLACWPLIMGGLPI